jgi:hypothetical protein
MKKHMLFTIMALAVMFLAFIVSPISAAPASSPGMAKPTAVASVPSSFALVEGDIFVSLPDSGGTITTMVNAMSQTATSVEKSRHTIQGILLVLVMIFLLELYSFIRTFLMKPTITLNLKEAAHEGDKKAASATESGSAAASAPAP